MTVKCDNHQAFVSSRQCENDAVVYFRWERIPGEPLGARCSKHRPDNNWGSNITIMKKEDYMIASVHDS